MASAAAEAAGPAVLSLSPAELARTILGDRARAHFAGATGQTESQPHQQRKEREEERKGGKRQQEEEDASYYETRFLLAGSDEARACLVALFRAIGKGLIDVSPRG